MVDEAAYTLFPSDAPKTPASPPAPTAGFHAITSFAVKPRQSAPTVERSESPAADLFPTEKMPDPAREVASTLEPWALSAQIEGHDELAAEWRETAETLAADLRNAGTSQEDTNELMQLVKDAQGNTTFGVVSDERLSADRAKAEDWIAENQIADADLDLARRLVDDMDRATPGLKAWLINSGQGNDPRTIALAVREAKRRYGR